MNEPYFVFYHSAMILSLLASLFVIVLMWKRRQAHGAKAIIVLSVATFVWTLGFLLEANSDTLEQQLFFTNIGYIGLMSVPVAWFIFALNYTSDNQLVTGWRIAPLCIIPLVTVALVWSNNWHHLMWFDEHLVTTGPFTVTAKTYGSFLWIAFAYSYILIITGVIILIRRLFVGVPLYKGQAISLIVAASLPLIWNFIYLFNLVPLPRKDLTPVMFAISGIAIALGLMRFQLFTAVPFARKFLIHQLSVGILVFDVRYRLLEVNPAALKIIGMDKNIIGKGIEHLPLLSPVLERLFSTGSGRVELPLTVSGDERLYELETVPMYDNQDRQVGWLAILHDITEPRRLEEQLRHSQVLASLGQMTAGIAHEVGNPLASIVLYSEAVMNDSSISRKTKKDLKVIHNEAKRAGKLMMDLMAYSRKLEPNMRRINVHSVIEKVIGMLQYQLNVRNIKIKLDLLNGPLNVKGNGSQLTQVFMNLVLNAEEALKNVGQGNIVVSSSVEDGWVKVSIIDDGPGIPKKYLDQIFMPFFTTKDIGEGTGLGLSICYGIISAHDGVISAENNERGGATFTVRLPLMGKGRQGTLPLEAE